MISVCFADGSAGLIGRKKSGLSIFAVERRCGDGSEYRDDLFRRAESQRPNDFDIHGAFAALRFCAASEASEKIENEYQ